MNIQTYVIQLVRYTVRTCGQGEFNTCLNRPFCGGDCGLSESDSTVKSSNDYYRCRILDVRIDDGKNRVGADLLHMIWNVMQENDIEIPFPQREVRILNDESGFTSKP
jgi:hypothetical protein